MTTTITDLRPIRSILSVPAHDERKVAGARSRGADLVMWDLEDSVPAQDKEAALRGAVSALSPGDCVRINHPSTATFTWEAAALHGRAQYVHIMVPKVESPDDLAEVLGAFGPGISIIACIESPSAIWRLRDLLTAGIKLAGLAFGRADFTATSPPGSFDLCASAAIQIAMAAAALGIHSSDGPCYALNDPAALARDIAYSSAQGFISKGAIHPDQLGAIHAGMRPTQSERAEARCLLESPGRNKGGGVQRLGSGVIAPPLILAAQRVLSCA